jgi:hypothetical protein
MMRDKLIINDIHLGVERMAGTTPASQLALQQYLATSMHSFIMQHTDKDLIIGGDLFDAFEVSLRTLIVAYTSIAHWLNESSGIVYLQDGNHDVGKRNDRPSSFSALGEILQRQFPGRVVRVREIITIIGDFPMPIYLVPHCMNQTLFDLEVDKLQDAPGGFVLFHANCMSPFAEHSDHSLNVAKDTLVNLARHHIVLFAHEHQARTIDVQLGAYRVRVLGNQWPSSIADCLANGDAQKDGYKYAHVLHPDGNVEKIQTWHSDHAFLQCDWQDLSTAEAAFIRVTGTVRPEQAADAVNAVARFRQQSQAFVVANDIKVAASDAEAKITELNVQSIRSFDVMAALLEQLEPAEREELKKIMEEE